MQGQLVYFGMISDKKDECESQNAIVQATTSKSSVAIERFKKEVLRVFGVLEIQLSGKYTGKTRDYLAGNGKGKYSVADIGTWRA